MLEIKGERRCARMSKSTFTVQVSHTHNCCSAYAYNERTNAQDPNTKKHYTYKSKSEELVSSKTYLTETAQKFHPEWADGRTMWEDIAAFEGTSYKPKCRRMTKKQAEKILEAMGKKVVPEELKDKHYIRQGIKMMVAVPRGIKTEQARQDFIDSLAAYLNNRGMCCTISLHHKMAKDGKPNDHIHILGMSRPLDEQGEFVKYKQKKVYKLDKNGEKIPIYEKTQKLDEQGKPVYINGRPVLVNKLDENGNPIQKRGERGRRLYERTTEEQTPWDRRAFVQEFRVACQDLMNEQLRKFGEELVDARSARHRGLHIITGEHEGPGDADKYKIKGHFVVLNEDIFDRQERLDLNLRVTKPVIDTKEGVKNGTADRDIADFLAGIAAAERQNNRAGNDHSQFDIAAVRIAAAVNAAERQRAAAEQQQAAADDLLATVGKIQRAAQQERAAAARAKRREEQSRHGENER